MCTYVTEKIEVTAVARAGLGSVASRQRSTWTTGPCPSGHTVNIEVLNPALGHSAPSHAKTEETAACAGRGNPAPSPPPRGLGLEEPKGLMGTAMLIEPAARCADRFDQRSVTVELQPDGVAARDEQQQFLRLAGHGERRPPADGDQRPCPPGCAATLGRVPWPESAGP